MKAIGAAAVTLHLIYCATAAAGTATWTEPLTGMQLVAIRNGCFQMGSRDALPTSGSQMWTFLGYRTDLAADEKPSHEVCLDAFWIGKYEVRADEWQRIMEEPPPVGRGAAPASGITWHQAQAFVHKLNERSDGGSVFRLPTEAEWEYACRAGVKKEAEPLPTAFLGTAWYSGGAQRLPAPAAVGRLKANAWGLHDMLGNVWEWAEDSYQAQAYSGHSLFNPVVHDPANEARVIRGGSHRSEYLHIRCAKRGRYPAADTLDQIGLRLVRTTGPVPGKRK